jgi:membrane associated rhomboid family serine protease
VHSRHSLFNNYAPVTGICLVINIVLFVYSAVRSQNPGMIHPRVLYELGGNQPEAIWEGDWYRLIAANFLHGGFLHILCNMLSLRQLGPQAETYFGSSNFGTLYILSGVGACCFATMFEGGLMIGASGCIFGIIGAELVVHSLRAPRLRHAWRSSEVRNSAMWVAIFFLLGISGVMGNVSNWGHFGGFVVGALLGGFFEVWRSYQRLGFALVLSVLLSLAGLVMLARWTFFSPAYHVHQAVIAIEDKRLDDAERDLKEAWRWAKIWKKEAPTAYLIQEIQAGEWDRETAHRVLYRNIYAARYRSVPAELKYDDDILREPEAPAGEKSPRYENARQSGSKNTHPELTKSSAQ